MNNPYNYHLPVQDDDMFFGRARLLRRLVEGLTQPTPISSAVFAGRRFGKTSLLRKLERGMRQGEMDSGSRRLIPWYYDPQAGYPISSGDDFFLLVLGMLQRALHSSTPDSPSGIVSIEQIEDTYESALYLGPVHAFAETFQRLTGGLSHRIRLVILIDEAEALLAAPWGSDLRPNLRNLLGNSAIADSLALVMSGSTAFHTQVAEKDSPLENILTRYSLANLTHEETLALAREPTGGQLPAGSAEQVWVQTGGHPCLVQFIMQELWYDLPKVAVEDVQDVAVTFSDLLNHYERWGDALSPLAHDAYRWLAHAERDGPAPFGNVRTAFASTDGRDLLRALDVLAYHGLIQVSGRGRRTRYAVAGHMFRDWYASTQPVSAPAQGPPSGTGAQSKYQIHIGHAEHVAIGDRAQVVHRESRPSRASAEEPRLLGGIRRELTHARFDVEVETRGPGRYEVQVLNAPAGPVRSAEVAFDPSEPQLQAMLQRVQMGDVDGALLREVGRRLHAFLFPDRVWAAYVASREAARAQDRGLCTVLRLHQPELAVLPWELLYDPQGEQFVALSGHTPLIRTLPGVLGAPLPPASSPWRLLLVTAAPRDWPELEVARERGAILEAVDPLVGAGQMLVSQLDHATPATLLDALRAGHHWLHFIGHGIFDAETGGGALILEEEDGSGERVDVDTLRHLLVEEYAQASARLRMVFLNACATAQVGIVPGTRGLAQTLVRAGVPTAIGMGRPIADASARAFSGAFYSALAEQNWPFYLAVTEGRRRVMVESGLHGGDWAVPALYERQG